MLIAALFAAALTLDGGQAVSVVARAAEPAEARPQTAPAEGGTRRVCRLERATGSNLQQRVCRTVRVAAGAQDQQTREFLRNLQRVRTPDVH